MLKYVKQYTIIVHRVLSLWLFYCSDINCNDESINFKLKFAEYNNVCFYVLINYKTIIHSASLIIFV